LPASGNVVDAGFAEVVRGGVLVVVVVGGAVVVVVAVVAGTEDGLSGPAPGAAVG
jgi:hypothetical protein